MSENASAQVLADRLTALMSKIASDAKAALTPQPQRIVQVAPGESVAWDDCCSGQLWVRLVSIAPAPTATPDRRPGADACAVPFFVATLEVGILRCAAVVNDVGDPPSALQVTTDGVQSVSDMAQLLAVLRCMERPVRTLGAWTPQGPEGGCHGGFWQFTVGLDNCIECPEPVLGEP